MGRYDRIGIGSRVVMHYALALEDGSEVDSTRDDEPVEFTMGDGTLIKGLELALYGLGEGDKQTIAIDAKDAYGQPNPELVHELPRAQFPDDMALEPGQVVGFTLPDGNEIPGMVMDIGEDAVQVDFNHPLAGHTVRFDVEILAVETPLGEE